MNLCTVRQARPDESAEADKAAETEETYILR